MVNWAQKIEERTNLSVSDIADDTVQGLALTGILALLVTWAVLMLQTI